MGQKRKAADIYTHFPCFDGLCSAVLTAQFYEDVLGITSHRYIPVNYDLRATWQSTKISAQAAVVDFLYHPQALFWADHHKTTFQGNPIVLDQLEPGRYIYFDPSSPSCALMLWKSLFSQIRDPERFADLVYWANKIDSASYDDVGEAIFGTSAASKISMSLIENHGASQCDLLVRSLRTLGLDATANLPLVRESAASVNERISGGLRLVGDAIQLIDEIAVLDIVQQGDLIVSRYSPYYFFPSARYSVSLIRSSAGAKITAMRNPWFSFESVSLGPLFEQFGGGGHDRVASVVVPSDDDTVARTLLRLITAELHDADSRLKDHPRRSYA